jgi:predicted metal-dependent phosphoesterase TrpH
MMKIGIQAANLHIHSRCSDGYLTPKQIVDKARANSIDIISITDHDSVEAYRYLSRSQIPLRLLPGIEFSSTWEDNDIHILGFGVDTANPALLEILHWMSDGRRTRAQKMLHKLEQMGMPIPMDLVLSFAGEKKLIVRPHVASALVASKYCRTKQEAFEKYIGNDRPAFVPKPILSTPEVIDYIHQAGGVAIVAHPGKIKSPGFINEFIMHGLDGLEIWHPDHNDWQINAFRELCNAHGLYKTGGSDFHGEEDVHNYLGPVPLADDILESITKIWENYKCRISLKTKTNP